MKQSKVLKEMYQACLSQDKKFMRKLRKIEFAKILERKQKGKPFTVKWTLADI